MKQCNLVRILHKQTPKPLSSVTKHIAILATFVASLFFTALALAATYSLPADIGTFPFNNCSFSSGTTYNCTGSLSFDNNDTLNITSPMTLNLTSGSLSAQNNFTINNGGNNFTISAPLGDITINNNFTGSVNLSAGGSIDIKNNAEITGNLTATTLSLGNNTTVIGICTPNHTSCALPLAPLRHVRLNHNGSGVTCSGSSITVHACNSADTAGTCIGNTNGLTGNITAGAVSVPFTIPSGSSSTTVNVRITTPQTVTLATSGLSVTPINATTCWNGSSASCSHVFNDSGFIFDIPHHVAETLQAINIRAVRKSDNSLACTPAFANVSRNLTLRCNYSNPTTGTLPVRVNGTALNATNNTTAACDTGGRTVSLAFNASGVASATIQYSDVGNMSLTGTHTGSGADAGLIMTGSGTFIAAPKDFAFSAITATPIKAGNHFSATVTARNNANNPVPNFGKETVAESATLNFVKYQPTGAGAVNGSFSGTLGAFNAGAATSTNLIWSEVGTIDLNATLTSGNYLGSSLTATGSTGATGAVGPFIPNHFDTVVTQGCSAGAFTYSGQPFTVEVTARNLSGNKTINYDGSSNTIPNFAKNTTLSDANALISGNLVSANILSTAYIAGVATTTTPAFIFNIAKTAPVSIKLRATDTDNVTSAATEGIANIRSGRLRLQNAYGSELLTLPIPLEAQYWNGNSYIRNQLDNCTSIAASTIAMGNYRNNLNACETQIGYSSGSGAFTNGTSNFLRLTAPGAGNSGSVDLSINLNGASGSTCAPASGSAGNANMPWFGANPTSRATFGIYKTPIIYLRENY